MELVFFALLFVCGLFAGVLTIGSLIGAHAKKNSSNSSEPSISSLPLSAKPSSSLSVEQRLTALENSLSVLINKVAALSTAQEQTNTDITQADTHKNTTDVPDIPAPVADMPLSASLEASFLTPSKDSPDIIHSTPSVYDASWRRGRSRRRYDYFRSDSATSSSPHSADWNQHVSSFTPDKQQSTETPLASSDPQHTHSHTGLLNKFGLDNIWVLAGVGLVLLGVVFLVRLIAEHMFFSPTMRLGGAAALGVFMIIFGWWLRSKRRGLSLIIQGGGFGALYVTVVAAVQLYDLLAAQTAFSFLIILVILSTLCALLQNSRTMAHVTNAAAFLAPLLVSTGSGNYQALFTYYVLLNVALIGITHFKAWRSLNLSGFILTAWIGTLWGDSSYTPELYGDIQIFLVIFFVLFTWLTIAGSRPLFFLRPDRLAPTHHKNISPEGLIDIPLMFAVPALMAWFQAVISKDMPYVLAFVLAAMAVLYILFFSILRARRVRLLHLAAIQQENPSNPEIEINPIDTDASHGPMHATSLYGVIQKAYTLQAELYAFLAFLCANAAVTAVLFDAVAPDIQERLLPPFWALQAAAFYWYGHRNSAKILLVIGRLTGILALITHFSSLTNIDGFSLQDTVPAMVLLMLSYIPIGAAFIGAAAATWFFNKKEWQSGAKYYFEHALLCFLGFVTLYSAWILNILASPVAPLLYALLLGASICIIIGAAFIQRWSAWPALWHAAIPGWFPILFLAPSLFLSLLGWAQALPSFLESAVDVSTLYPLRSELILYLLFILFDAWILARWNTHRSTLDVTKEEISTFTARLITVRRVALPSLLLLGFGPLAATLTLTFPALSDTQGVPLVWMMMEVLGLIAATLLLIPALMQRGLIPQQYKAWIGASILPLGTACLWLMEHTFTQGLPFLGLYLPVLNSVEGGTLILVAATAIWWRQGRKILIDVHHAPPPTLVIYSVLTFVVAVLSMGAIRATSFWLPLPFDIEAIMDAPLLQAALTLLWGTIGIVCMIIGNRTKHRIIWLFGMGLILCTIAKLFFVDLTRIATMWRIVSFMGVGTMLILIGAFVPLPPRHPHPAASEKSPRAL